MLIACSPHASRWRLNPNPSRSWSIGICSTHIFFSSACCACYIHTLMKRWLRVMYLKSCPPTGVQGLGRPELWFSAGTSRSSIVCYGRMEESGLITVKEEYYVVGVRRQGMGYNGAFESLWPNIHFWRTLLAPIYFGCLTNGTLDARLILDCLLSDRTW